MAYMKFEGPGFVMEVPTNWLITSSVQYQVMFLAPPTGNGVRPNLMVTVRPIEEGASPIEVATLAQRTQERQYEGYKVLNEIDYTQRGGSGFERSYTWIQPETQQTIFQIQAFFVLHNAIYTLTATCLANQGEAYEPDYSHMIESFRVVPL